MRPFCSALTCTIFLICVLYSGATLAADTPPIEQRVTTLEENLKTQNQKFNEIQKKVNSYDQNSRDVTHTLDKIKLLQESTKEAKSGSGQFLEIFISLFSISVVLFIALIGYGAFSQNRMNNEIREARADVEKIRELRKEAEKEREEDKVRREREKEEDKITRSKTFAATALSLSLAWEKATGDERERLWNQANDYYQQATNLDPRNASAWHNWGTLICNEARQVNYPTPDLWAKADKCYQHATKVNENYKEVWSNWGNLLVDQAKFTNDPNSDLWIRADECYQRATEIDKNYKDAWNNWGNLLLNQAKFTNDPNSDLWIKADKYYQRATEIDKNYKEAWFNWGFSLSDWAKLTGDPNSDLWARADARYQRATEIDKNYKEAWHNWAISDLHRAEITPEENRLPLLREAQEKLKKAIELGSELSKGVLKGCEEYITKLEREEAERTDGESSKINNLDTPPTVKKDDEDGTGQE